MLDRFGGCCLYDESSRDPDARHGVLGWLIGGAAAEDMSRRADEELIAAALDSLPNFLAHGRQHFVEPMGIGGSERSTPCPASLCR